MGVQATWEEQPAPADPPVRLLTLVLHYDDLVTRRSATFRIDATVLSIGRGDGDGPAGPDGDGWLRLPDRWMSTTHCQLERRGDGDVISDRGSRNGTWVNGARIDEHRLADGDLIEVGHSLLCYRRVPASAAEGLETGVVLGPTTTHSPEMADLARRIARIAPSREPVLLLGETGCGKEVVANALHAASGRSGPLCPVDCGAIPESLFEATFFGHVRGAFTGADSPRTGEILRADGGTLLLDEVANMSVTAQGKLLRVLEDARVTPLGADRPTAVDVRWVAATNRDLLADPGSFRPDLLRRLAGFVGRIPPLRHRREDLGELAAHLLTSAGFTRVAIGVAAARRLFCDPLPGNVRQLGAALRSAATLAGDRPIDVADLPALGDGTAGTEAGDAAGTAAAGRPSRQASAEQVAEALAATGGNVAQAARRLDVHPRQLYRWIERYRIDLDAYRPPAE